MDAREEGIEVEPGLAWHDDLAVEDEVGARERGQAGDELREVAAERPVMAAAKFDTGCGSERQAAKAVPLRFIDPVASG